MEDPLVLNVFVLLAVRNFHSGRVCFERSVLELARVEIEETKYCTVQLANNTNHHVAFKIKTTSPKKYCVRPNVGIVFPKSACEFSG
ncbi:Vesicle-associated protein 2-2, partial [Cucurbita argyrosperma subsp. argyrosperma]